MVAAPAVLVAADREDAMIHWDAVRAAAHRKGLAPPQRLQRVRAEYDPDGVLLANHQIEAASCGTAA